LRRDPSGRAPVLTLDQRARPRIVCLEEAHWEKLKMLVTQWLERKLNAEPGACLLM
jgi:hypothetical protein